MAHAGVTERAPSCTTFIMSGKNHAYGHYHAYDRTLADGDFSDPRRRSAYRNYHVDISTTFPTSGRFTPRQCELYEAALVVCNAAIDAYRPGITLRKHSIGLATHDVMGTFAGPDEVLKPGFVFACDIQLFRVDEEIGIRLEDTVAITDSGHECCRAACRTRWLRSRR